MARPTGDQWNFMIYAYAACTLCLAVKYQWSQMMGFDLANHPKEDERMNAGRRPVDEETQKRRNRQAANDVDNIPFNMVIFWAAFVVQMQVNFSSDLDGQPGTRALTAVIIAYTASRFLYTVCYFTGVQPFRSIFYMMGSLCPLVAAAILVYSAFLLDANNWV